MLVLPPLPTSHADPSGRLTREYFFLQELPWCSWKSLGACWGYLAENAPLLLKVGWWGLFHLGGADGSSRGAFPCVFLWSFIRPKEKKTAFVNHRSHGSLTASQHWLSSRCNEDDRSVQAIFQITSAGRKHLKQVSPSTLMKVSNKSDFAGQLNAGLNHRLTDRPLTHCTSTISHILPLYALFYVP